LLSHGINHTTGSTFVIFPKLKANYDFSSY
jgi:hypothetical protein